MSTAGSSAGGMDFGDFQVVRNMVANNTVDRLKAIIASLNTALHLGISKSGRKAELIAAVQTQLDRLRNSPQQLDRWLTARRIIKGDASAPPTATATTTAAPTTPGAGTSSTAYYAPPKIHASPGGGTSSPSSSSWARTTLPPPRTPASSSSSSRPSLRFKPSPFFVLETSLTEISSPSDVRTTQERGTISVSYTLTSTQHSSLRSGGSTSNASHQIRLYCTSNSHWTPNGSMGALSIPIEFPPVVEVRVNGTAIQGANTRGLKKKAGTAPPVDLSKLSRVGQNKVDFTFMNNSSPFVYKKFYFMINYVKYTPVTELVARLRSGRTRSYDDVKRQLWAAPSVDDDIIAGAQKITLKCPLSYMRISTPARASTCTHGQCFDALSWYSMMEQTTTYLCPVCDRSLNYEDLIMDGFFDQILVNTPEDTEEIMVEPDGEWHTLDHKHHSSGYKPPKPKVAPSGSRTTSMTPVKRESSVAPGRAPSVMGGRGPERRPSTSGPPPGASVVVLDSDDDDDDDDGYHTAPSQAYNNSQTSAGTARRASGVIDLTLDSDDDEPAPPPARTPAPAPTSSRAPPHALSARPSAPPITLPPLSSSNVNSHTASSTTTAQPSRVMHPLPPRPGPRISLAAPSSSPGGGTAYHRAPSAAGTSSSPPAPSYAIPVGGDRGKRKATSPPPPLYNSGSGSGSGSGYAGSPTSPAVPFGGSGYGGNNSTTNGNGNSNSYGYSNGGYSGSGGSKRARVDDYERGRERDWDRDWDRGDTASPSTAPRGASHLRDSEREREWDRDDSYGSRDWERDRARERERGRERDRGRDREYGGSGLSISPPFSSSSSSLSAVQRTKYTHDPSSYSYSPSLSHTSTSNRSASIDSPGRFSLPPLPPPPLPFHGKIKREPSRHFSMMSSSYHPSPRLASSPLTAEQHHVDVYPNNNTLAPLTHIPGTTGRPTPSASTPGHPNASPASQIVPPRYDPYDRPPPRHDGWASIVGDRDRPRDWRHDSWAADPYANALYDGGYDDYGRDHPNGR